MKPTVLIVDDEQVICDGLARLLSNEYRTFQALNADEALEIVANNKQIDAMLCDIVMPGMDGNELIEKVRSCNSDISIIVMTASPDAHRVCNAMKNGARGFLLKPLDLSQLQASVKNAIKHKRHTVSCP